MILNPTSNMVLGSPEYKMLLFISLASTVLFQFALAAVRTSPPSGALTVGSSGTYKTISAAVAAASKGASIFIYAGTYNEAVYVTKDEITLYGQTSKYALCTIIMFMS